MAMVPGLFTALVLSAGKALLRVATALENRRQAKSLNEWDARALKDIGLTQGDLAGAMALPLHRDPTLFLASLRGGQHPSVSDVIAQGTSRPAMMRLDRLGVLPSAEPAPIA